MEEKKKDNNFEIEQATNKNIERYEPTRKWSVKRRWSGTLCRLGPDSQRGRHVYLCLGPYGYFVSSRKSYGRLTNRTASLKLAGIRPSQITLELAIWLLDKIDAYRLRKIAERNRGRSDVPNIGRPITVQQSNSRASYFILICIASE